MICIYQIYVKGFRNEPYYQLHCLNKVTYVISKILLIIYQIAVFYPLYKSLYARGFNIQTWTGIGVMNILNKIYICPSVFIDQCMYFMVVSMLKFYVPNCK